MTFAPPIGHAPGGGRGNPHVPLGKSMTTGCHPPVTHTNESLTPMHPTAPSPAEGDDLGPDCPLELEHALGFSGQYLHTVLLHPTATPPVVIYCVGKLVVFSVLEDLHQQTVLRGHDARVTALDVSESGRYVVSGQSGSLRSKEEHGFIVVWDYESRTPIYQLLGHLRGVYCVKLSLDDRWIASTGVDGRLLIWDMQNGQLAGGIKEGMDNEVAMSVLWGPIEEPGTRRQAYSLTATYNTGVRSCRWAFEVKTLQYHLSTTTFQLPGAGGRLGGFMRQYNCSATSGPNLLCGTSTGDIVVYNTESHLYRTSFPVGSNGVLSLAAGPGGVVIAGMGDGSVTRISGDDRNWNLETVAELEGGVTSLHPSCDFTEVIAATNAGVMYRVLTRDLSHSVVVESHTSGISDVAYPESRSDRFATSSTNGMIRMWDINEYITVSKYSHPRTTPTCIVFAPKSDSIVIAGWVDGGVRAVDLSQPTGTLVWEIPTAHKGGITSLAPSELYLLTGGADSIARVWTMSSRECVTVLQDHAKVITAVMVDNTTPTIVHTASLDKALMSFDLSCLDRQYNRQAPKRITHKTDHEGSGFTAMTQRKDSEHEIIAATRDGKLHFYDIDYPQSVCTLIDRNRVCINSVTINPAGNHLAVSQQDGLLVIYAIAPNKATGAAPKAQARCHSSEVLKAVWSPDGKQLVSIGSDHDLCIWNFFH